MGEQIAIRWETALRPQTIDQLRAPDDYRRGGTALLIRDEVDKNRFGRELPLSEPARAALECVCPDVGILFGSHDYRHLHREAAKAAGIDEFRAKRISDYDFLHSRLTHLGQVSSNLSGVMFLAGHKQSAHDRAVPATSEAGRCGGAPGGSRCRRIPVAFRSHEQIWRLRAGEVRRQKSEYFQSSARTGTRTPMAVNR
jgi:hypothetical protein